jgi:hypothetical protein
MHFQYVVAPPSMPLSAPPPALPNDATADLLRELIGVQRDQLAYLKANHDAQHANGRWQAFLSRWSAEFPEVGQGCQQALPMVEQAFIRLVDEMTRRLLEEESGGIEDEFTLNEFLDRYGARLGQLGSMLNVLGPLADAARTSSGS